ncbi:MAG: sulfatase [Cyclobacteriaceae bacterium]
MCRSWIVIILITSFACQSAVERPNIIWIIADDLSPDLGCYGNQDVRTPNLDNLASEGVRFTNAYANAPVCSSSRSSFITGMYPTAINSLSHRTMIKKPLPNGIETIVSRLQRTGYFCTNASGFGFDKLGKTDYNFSDAINYDGTDWRQAGEAPFFAQIQIKYPHRPFSKDKTNPIDPEQISMQSCYPDHPLLCADWANYLDDVQLMDSLVGEILNRLEEDGMVENTVIMFFGDHGRPHLRDKQFLYEGGLKVPLIVRYPNQLEPSIEDQLVSLVDVAATTLKLAGLGIPEDFHGNPFLVDEKKREYVFGFRGRSGDAVDDIRSITNGQFKLIWNRMPEKPYMQLSSYKKAMYPAFTLYCYLDSLQELEAPFNQFMVKMRPEFELYNLKEDPCEYSNLIGIESFSIEENRLKRKLVESLKKYEKNGTIDSEEVMEVVRKNSLEYLKNKMNGKGIDVNSSLERWMVYWHDQYNIQNGQEFETSLNGH